MPEITIAVHGGAGRPGRLVAEEVAYHDGLRAGLDAGHAVLAGGGAALDAVEAAVRSLEDDPLFNAGRGSVLTRGGWVEMDASIMEGTGRAGAVGAVRRVRHPVSLARAFLDGDRQVLMVGTGAEKLARKAGFETREEEWFIIGAQRERWRRRRRRRRDSAPPTPGTVGAAALDARGRLAAATSTGGRTDQPRGRVGDSAVLGAGTWAQDGVCAVSLTGNGEAIMRLAASHELAALVIHGGLSLERAADEVVNRRLVEAEVGLIALDPAGGVSMPVNCGLMHRGVRRGDGEPWTAIHAR